MNRYIVRAEVLMVVRADTPEDAVYRAGCFAAETSLSVEEGEEADRQFCLESLEFFFKEDVEPSCPRAQGLPQ